MRSLYIFILYTHTHTNIQIIYIFIYIHIVLDLVSQVRDVILMNVYLNLGDPGGSDFGMRGIWVRGGK